MTDALEHYAVLMGQMIAVNAAFSFSSDAVAQLLEGKRCCVTSTVVAEEEEPAREATTTTAAASEEKTSSAPSQPVVPFDWNRAITFAASGVIFCGVVQFFRLEVIDMVFPDNSPSFATAVLKTGFNQLVFSPVVRAASMGTIQYTKTRDCNDFLAKLKADFMEAQAVSYAVKPVSNVLAFWIFPHHIIGQTVVMRTVAFAYNVYYSYMANRDVASTPEEAAKKEAKKKAREEAEEAAAAAGAAGAPSRPTSTQQQQRSRLEEIDDDGVEVGSEGSSLGHTSDATARATPTDGVFPNTEKQQRAPRKKKGGVKHNGKCVCCVIS